MPSIALEYDEYYECDPDRERQVRRDNAELLADKWIAETHAEFVNWLDGRVDYIEIAQLFAGTFPRGKWKELRDGFIEHIITARIKR